MLASKLRSLPYLSRVIRVLGLLVLCASLPISVTELDAKKGKGGGNSGGGGNPGGGGNSGGSTIGDASGATTARYHLSSWNVRGNYTIVGPTVMVVDGDVNIGNNTVTIAPTGSLTLYVGGNMKANGRGSINNLGVPSQLMVFGTHPEKLPSESPDYSLTLSGNGALTGIVYAPNAQYRTNGGGNAGQTSGSVVALDVRFNGSPGPFHYDVALRDLDLPFGGYALSNYELRPAGDLAPSSSARTVLGNSDYDSLFTSLFDSP